MFYETFPVKNRLNRFYKDRKSMSRVSKKNENGSMGHFRSRPRTSSDDCRNLFEKNLERHSALKRILRGLGHRQNFKGQNKTIRQKNLGINRSLGI